jgi:beta-phosphoglucomutase-like phosphatase (HAD superfamily)
MIKAVIFDMDGLLIDSEPLWQKAQIDILKTVGIKPKQDDFKHVLGTGLEATVEFWYHKQPWAAPSRKDIEALIKDDFIALFKQRGALRPGVQQTLDLFKVRALPEDAPAGVLAAKAAKMKCVAVPELHAKEHPFIGVADMVLDSLTEFNAAMLSSLENV